MLRVKFAFCPRLKPRTWNRPKPITSVTRRHSRLRPSLVGSPCRPAVSSSSLSYGLVNHLPLLPTPPHGDAVAVDYRIKLKPPGWDFHPPIQQTCKRTRALVLQSREQPTICLFRRNSERSVAHRRARAPPLPFWRHGASRPVMRWDKPAVPFVDWRGGRALVSRAAGNSQASRRPHSGTATLPSHSVTRTQPE